MKRIYFGLISISLAVLVSCDPVADTIPAENETQTENGQVSEPEDVLSTLKEDREVIIDVAPYTACFGDWYDTGYSMWGIYLQAYDTKEQIYLEILNNVFDLTVPTGTYTVSGTVGENTIIPGVMMEENDEILQTYSWYVQVDASSGITPVYKDMAPIAGGTLTISEDPYREGWFRFEFDLTDDAGHRIFGFYEGGAVIEDFRAD